MKYNSYTIVTTFMAALFGAGFIAGKEIQYFFLYDTSLIIPSIIIYFIILFTLSIITMSISYKTKPDSFEMLVSKDNAYIQWFARIVYPLFAICLLTIFFSGFATLFESTFSINKFVGSIVITLLVCIVALFGSTNISRLFKITTPILFFSLVSLLIYILFDNPNPSINISQNTNSHPSSSQFFNVVLYSLECYQFSVILIFSLAKRTKSLKDINVGAFLSCLIFSLAILLITTILIKYNSIIGLSQIPLLEIVNYQNNQTLTIVYTIIMFTGFITASLSIIFGYINFINESSLKSKTKFITIITCFISLVFSQLSFSVLISTIFPIIGIIGLFIFTFILFNNRNIFKTK